MFPLILSLIWGFIVFLISRGYFHSYAEWIVIIIPCMGFVAVESWEEYKNEKKKNEIQDD